MPYPDCKLTGIHQKTYSVKYFIVRYLLVILSILSSGVQSEAKSQRLDKDWFPSFNHLSPDSILKTGLEFESRNQPDSALVCYTVLAERFRDHKPSRKEARTVVKALNQATFLYSYKYFDYAKAFSAAKRALKIIEPFGDNDLLPSIYLNLANLYEIDYQRTANPRSQVEMVKLYREAFRLAAEQGNTNVIDPLLANVVNLTFWSGEYGMADEMIARYRKMPGRYESPMASFLNCLISMMQATRSGNYRKAISMMPSLRNLIDSNQSLERYLINTYVIEGLLYDKLKDYGSAITSFRNVEKLARQYGVADMLPSVYEYLSRYSSQLGHPEDAASYRNLYLSTKDSLLTTRQLGKIGEMHFLSNLQDAADENSRLHTKNRIQSIILCFSIVLLICIVLFSLVVFRKNRALRHSYDVLFEKNLTLLSKEEQAVRRHIPEKESSDAEKEKYRNSPLDVEMRKDLFVKITNVMTSDSIFESGFSLGRLSEIVGMNPKYVSQTINEETGWNFYRLLNEYRIREACRIFNDSVQRREKSVEGIALSLGFKSRSNFSAVFKSITGMSSTEYMKRAAK